MILNSLVFYSSSFLPSPNIEPVVAMPSFSLSASSCSKFWGHPPFPKVCCEREYVNYMDSRRFADMHESGASLMIRDCHWIAQVTFVGVWIK